MMRFAMMSTGALAISLGSVALAVQTASWEHTTEADFAAGETDAAVVTSLGDIKLATGTQLLAESPEEVTIFGEVQLLDGVIYIAAGPRGQLLRRQGDELEQVLTLEDEQVFALDVYDGKLLVAVSGETSRLAVLENDELRTLVALPGVRYLWDVLVREGVIFVATGVDGKILRVVPNELEPFVEARADDAADAAVAVPTETDTQTADSPQAADGTGSPVPTIEDLPGVTKLLDVAQANVLCLGMDGRGRLYAGTDTDGLIYRLSPVKGGGYEAFVIYDAAEPEIGALLVREDGTVFAGTADAEQARPGRLAEAAAESTGRPELGDAPPAEAGEEDAPDADDLPQVPPGAEPIGEPDGDANATSAAPLAQANQTPAAVATAAGEAGDAAPAAPTAEQYDRLREVIRARLDAARRTGTLQAGTAQRGRRPAVSPAGATRARPPAAQARAQDGNAVYRIDPQGFVSEVFRESVMILRIVEVGDRLLIATGNQGQVFSINPRADETTMLVDLDAEQVPAMLLGPDGGVMLGTANPAQLLLLTDTVADQGTYTSPVMDASQISLWGGLEITGDIPQDASVRIQTRSGNVQDPEQAPWSPWSEGHTLEQAPELPPLQPRQVTVQAPPARFLQYRLTLVPGGVFSPVVEQVKVTYVTPNMKPSITSIRATYPEPAAPGGAAADQPAPSTILTLEWEASDPNNDPLIYKLEYQPAGSDRWLLIDENLTQTRHEWQTRRVPDGRYLVRVTADDRQANPGRMALQSSRRSDAILVDNGRPTLTDLAFEQDGGRVVIRGTAMDALSHIRSIAYVVDDGDEYLPVLPDDLIFDSTSETFEIIIAGLSPGDHVVTLRVTDARGNTLHEPVLLNIRK